MEMEKKRIYEDEEEEDEKFIVRNYTKLELAMLYSPDLKMESAVRKLKRWVNGNTFLVEALAAVGANPNRHSYTAREVAIVVKYLGTPG